MSLPLCDPHREIHSIYHGKIHKLEIPVLACEVKCPRCGGDEGFYIPSDKCWSCIDPDCVKYNNSSCNREYKPISSSPKLSQYGVGAEHANWRFSNVEIDNELRDRLTEFAKNPLGFLILVGPHGTKKTSASCAAMQEYLSTEKENCYFINTSELYYQWLKELETGGRGLHTLDRFANYEFMVLDDVGQHIPKDGFLQFLYTLINRRRDKNFGTIITTNMSSMQLQETLGEAIFSRIVTRFNCLLFKGQDQRFAQSF